MTSAGMNWVVKVMILLVILIVISTYLYGPKGALLKAKELTFGIVDIAKKSFSIGPKPAITQESEAPSDVRAAYNNLLNIFNKWGDMPVERCLIAYDEFGSDWEDCRLGIIYSAVYGKGLMLIIECPDEWGNLKEIKASKIPRPDLIPCVVATDETIVQNFWDNWIEKKTPIKLPEYVQWNMFITGKYDIKIGKTYYDLEDEGLSKDGKEISFLYKADNNHICFLTTNDVYNCDANGIDDDFINALHSGYKLPYCEDYTFKTKHLGYFISSLLDIKNKYFIADATIVYYDAPEVSAYVNKEDFDETFDYYFNSYVKQTKATSLNQQEMGAVLKKWLNDDLPKRGIKEIGFSEARIADNDEAYYFKAWSLEQQNKTPQAFASYRGVLRDYPDSIYAPEADLRIAEMWFYSGHYYDAFEQHKGIIDNEKYVDYTGILSKSKDRIWNICEFKLPIITAIIDKQILEDECPNLNKTKYYPENYAEVGT